MKSTVANMQKMADAAQESEATIAPASDVKDAAGEVSDGMVAAGERWATGVAFEARGELLRILKNGRR